MLLTARGGVSVEDLFSRFWELHERRGILAQLTVRGRSCRHNAEVPPVETLLGPWLIVRIEDVGSISLPGLVAKPIVDLLQIARGAADSALLLS